MLSPQISCMLLPSFLSYLTLRILEPCGLDAWAIAYSGTCVCAVNLSHSMSYELQIDVFSFYQMVEIMVASLCVRKMMSQWIIWTHSITQWPVVSEDFALLGAHSTLRPPAASCSALPHSITILPVPWK